MRRFAGEFRTSLDLIISVEWVTPVGDFAYIKISVGELILCRDNDGEHRYLYM